LGPTFLVTHLAAHWTVLEADLLLAEFGASLGCLTKLTLAALGDNQVQKVIETFLPTADDLEVFTLERFFDEGRKRQDQITRAT
jgi:hypothetical protein